MDVEGVLHGVEGTALVVQPDLHDVAHPELPADVHVLAAGRGFPDDPAHLRGRRIPVHHGHRPAPLHGVEVGGIEAHQTVHHEGDAVLLHGEGEFAVDRGVEVLAVQGDLAGGVDVGAEGVEGGCRRGRGTRCVRCR